MWFILKIFKYVDESLISTCKLCWPDLECSNQRWKLQDVAGNRWASLKTLLIEEVHMKIHTSLEISFHWEKKKKNLHNSFCKDLQTSLGLIVHNSSFLLFQFGVLNNMGGGGGAGGEGQTKTPTPKHLYSVTLSKSKGCMWLAVLAHTLAGLYVHVWSGCCELGGLGL